MAERTVSSRVAFEGRLLRLRVDEVELDGGHSTTREIVDHPGAVAILAWDGERVALVRQWRHPAGRELLEVPAGTLDPHDAGRLATAERELAEEVGVAADSWEEGPSFFTAPGFCTEFMTLYFVTGLHPAEAQGDDDEDIAISWATLHEALHAIDDGSIQDGKTIAAILWLARRLGDGAGIGPA